MKSKIITFLFVGCLIFYGVLGILFEDVVFSVTERRKFASVPKFVFSNAKLGFTFLCKANISIASLTWYTNVPIFPNNRTIIKLKYIL